jgi:elongation factor 1-beta
MADVAVVLKLMPEGTEVDLGKIETMVRERARVQSVVREPIAFGLEALRVVALVEDAAGGTDPLENALSSIPGIVNVQVVGLTRVL